MTYLFLHIWGHGTWRLLPWLCKFCFLWHNSEKKTSQTTESTIQNLLGRVVTNSIQSSSHTLLQQLHWLPAEYGIDSKISNVTFRTLHSSQPTYLFSALHAHRSTRSFRLSYTKLLTVSFVQTSLNAHSFGFAGSKIWNSLPPAFWIYTFPATFRRHLKTHLFQLALQSPSFLHLRFSFRWTLCAFINYIYLFININCKIYCHRCIWTAVHVAHMNLHL